MGGEDGGVEQVKGDLRQFVLTVLEGQQDFAASLFDLIGRENGLEQGVEKKFQSRRRPAGQKRAAQAQAVAAREPVEAAGQRFNGLGQCQAREALAAAGQQPGDEVVHPGVALGFKQHAAQHAGLEGYDRNAVMLLDQQANAVVQLGIRNPAVFGSRNRGGRLRCLPSLNVRRARQAGLGFGAEQHERQAVGREIALRHAPNVLAGDCGQTGQIAVFVVRVVKYAQKIAQLASLALDGFPPIGEVAGQIRASPVEFGGRDQLVPAVGNRGQHVLQRRLDFVLFQGGGGNEQPWVGRAVGAGRDPVDQFLFDLHGLDQP